MRMRLINVALLVTAAMSMQPKLNSGNELSWQGWVRLLVSVVKQIRGLACCSRQHHSLSDNRQPSSSSAILLQLQMDVDEWSPVVELRAGLILPDAQGLMQPDPRKGLLQVAQARGRGGVRALRISCRSQQGSTMLLLLLDCVASSVHL